MRLVPVQAQDAHKWDISWHLQSFSDRSHGRFSVQYFVDGIESQEYQLWIAFDGKIKGVALTQVACDGLETVTLAQCAGEDAKDWAFLIQGIAEWAKDRGSECFKVICRPGWEKYLKEYGFRKTHIVMDLKT